MQMKERQQAKQEEDSSTSGSEPDSEPESPSGLNPHTSRSPMFRARASPRASPSRTSFDEMIQREEARTSPSIRVVPGDPEARQVQIWRHVPPSGRRLPLLGACPSNQHKPTQETLGTIGKLQPSPVQMTAQMCAQQHQQPPCTGSLHSGTRNDAAFSPEAFGHTSDQPTSPSVQSPGHPMDEAWSLSKGSSTDAVHTCYTRHLDRTPQAPLPSLPAHGTPSTATERKQPQPTQGNTMHSPLEQRAHSSTLPGHISHSPVRPCTPSRPAATVGPVLSDQRASIAAARTHARECLLRHSLVGCMSDLHSKSPCRTSPYPPQPKRDVAGGEWGVDYSCSNPSAQPRCQAVTGEDRLSMSRGAEGSTNLQSPHITMPENTTTGAEGAVLSRVAGGGGGLLHAVAVRSPASPQAMRELSNIVNSSGMHPGRTGSGGIATVQACRCYPP
jgi:hypothetical protein